MRTSLDIETDRTILFYVGSFHPQHGLTHFLELYEKLVERTSDVLFIMAGEGTRKEQAEDTVHGKELTPFVQFTGRISDQELVEYISAADFGLYPMDPDYRSSTERTFPQKVYEYLACGTPVISMADSSLLRNLLLENHAGCIIQQIQKPEAAAKELHACISETETDRPEQRRELVKEHSYENQVRKYARLLDKIKTR